MKIFIFNGPPASGKDAICENLQKTFGGVIASFKDELLNDASRYFKVSHDWFMSGYTREQKEVPEEALNGLSRRQAIIHVSEDIQKKIHGKEYYGKLLSQTLTENGADFAFIPDGGFIEEIQTVVDYFGPDNVVIVQLHRDGKNFDKDSRKYVTKTIHEDRVIGYKTRADSRQFCEGEVQGPRTIRLFNNGTLEAVFLVTEEIVKEEISRAERYKGEIS